MSPELIVFDLAGTTVKDNHDVHRALQKALAKYGVAISLEDANMRDGNSEASRHSYPAGKKYRYASSDNRGFDSGKSIMCLSKR